jgi:hypothetical protein
MGSGFRRDDGESMSADEASRAAVIPPKVDSA